MREPKRNRPVAALIKEYAERKKGKMLEAKAELHRRFDYLDYSQQKKILAAHLTASKSDRQWAYPRLLDHWDDSFYPIIKNLWETYQEERCAWVVIRFFPRAYIMEQLDALTQERDAYFYTQGRNYFHICMRFAADEDFVIDKTRLAPCDYLYVMHQHERTIPAEEATPIMYATVRDFCARYWGYRDWYYYSIYDTQHMELRYNEDRVSDLYPRRIKVISQAVYYLSKMSLWESVKEFYVWSDTVQADIAGSEEWTQLKLQAISDREYNRHAYAILIQTMRKHLPEAYQIPEDDPFSNINSESAFHPEAEQIREEDHGKEPLTKEAPSRPTEKQPEKQPAVKPKPEDITDQPTTFEVSFSPADEELPFWA